jgi:hypothetical protein
MEKQPVRRQKRKQQRRKQPMKQQRQHMRKLLTWERVHHTR